MKQITSKLIVILSTIIIFLLSTLIYTFLLYTDKVNNSSESIYKVTTIIGTIIFFLFGVFYSLVTKRKTLLITLFTTLVILLILFIIKRISIGYFDNKYLIKYALYLVSALLGSIASAFIPRNNKKKK